jgi:hypothetical protein
MFISLVVVGSELSRGFRLPHGLVPASSSSIRRKRMITSLVKEANFGYAVPARPQAPPSAVLLAPWLGWSCPLPRRGTERGPLHHGTHAKVVATAGEAARRRGGRRRW